MKRRPFTGFVGLLFLAILAIFLMNVLNRGQLLLNFNSFTDEEQAEPTLPPLTTPGLSFLQDALYKCGDTSRRLPQKKVAIISATTPHVDNAKCALGNADCSYAFYLPLTALSWRRHGYSTAAIIAGDDKPWLQNGTHLNFVYKTLLALGNITVIFMPTSNDLKTGIAQIGRVFVPDIEPFASEPDTYMVTSDVDLFPVTNIYDLQTAADDVRFTNGHCCDPFPHKGETIPMVALSNIGMRVSAWHAVMQYRGISNDTNPVERIKTALMHEFGHLPINAHRGPNNEWFFDQQIISIHLHHWFQSAGPTCKRSDFTEGRVRWDRVGWPMHQSKEEWLKGHDAHCPLPGHLYDAFKGLQPLAQLLAGNSFNVTTYWHQYMTAMGAKVPSLDEVLKEQGQPSTGSGYFHRPDLGI